jgi:hypothetical protein
MNTQHARLLLLPGFVAGLFVALAVWGGAAGGAESAAAAKPIARLEITDPGLRPRDPLHVWAECPKGTGAADVRSSPTGYAVLEAQPAGTWWFAAPQVRAGTRPHVYELRVLCTAGPGSPYSAATALYRVTAEPLRWTAESRTAESITGDARFTRETIVFEAGGTLRIRYLRDVAGSVSILGSSPPRAHPQLYRVESRSDLRMRAGNSFCGKRPTFISLLRSGSALDADIILTVYSGTSEPKGASSDAVCASYTYAPGPS